MRGEDGLVEDQSKEKFTVNRKSLTATTIAQFIRFNCCPRFFKLKIDPSEENTGNWYRPFRPTSFLLYGVGETIERTKIAELQAKSAVYYNFKEDYDPRHRRDWKEPVNKAMFKLRELISAQLSSKKPVDSRPILLYQVPMYGVIGVWRVKGIADLILIWPLQNGKVKVQIFEVKSSWKEQTAHRMQVAIYVLLLSRELSDLSSRVEFEGGVINRETNLQTLDPQNLKPFKLSPLIQDVERLLAEKGELNRIYHKPIDEIEYQLCWRCDNCGYNECCIVNAVETESISLLNLSRGEQHALKRYDIRKIEDLAKLKFVVDSFNLYPYDFKAVPARAEAKEKVEQISNDPIVGAKLDQLIQRAQFMLSGLRPKSQYASKSPWMPWLTGTGYGTLPEDSPIAGTNTWLMSKPDAMIRVYLFVEWDYMLELITLISARISCTLYKGQPPSVSKVIRNLPDDRNDGLTEEKLLLEDFFRDLTIAIKKVAGEIGCPDEAVIHLYFFSHRERDNLMRSVCRQPELIGSSAIRDLLGLRQAIDQPMFSIIQEEIQHRKALKFCSYGLLPILMQAKFSSWTTKRKDGSLVDLSSVFYDGFFNYQLPYKKNADDSLTFLREFGLKSDGYYPASARFSDQIPVEYIWGAKGRLERFKETGTEKISIEKRKWCDYRQKTRRITDEELALMGERICIALDYVERSLKIRNRRLGKRPLPIPTISEFSLGETSLKRSCNEFLDLEIFSKRQEIYQYYAMLPYQRVASGKSLIFECTSVIETDQDFIVNGKLVYEGIGLSKADCVANACRVKGSEEDGSSSGDWMVITEVVQNKDKQFEDAKLKLPSDIEKSALAIVDKVNSQKLEITVKIVKRRGRKSKFIVWHNIPTTDPEEAKNRKYTQLFEAGRFYIIDDMADDIVSDRSSKGLENVDSNFLYNLLADYLEGKTNGSLHTPLPKHAATNLLNWADCRPSPPKPKQKALIDQIFADKPIVMLQGPPGTGKTLTLQLAVLAHIAAHRAISKCRVLMVAPTHKAIHEFVTKLANCWSDYNNTGGNDLRDLKLYRVVNSNASNMSPIEGVTYLNYNEDQETVKELADRLLNQSTLVSNDNIESPLVLCVTPSGLFGLMKKIGGKEPPWGQGFFDLLVVDEASMMRVPELILSGSFLSKNSQIIVAGDHRQLPPIVAHDWDREDRRTLEELAAFLSAMDFLRLLRNEDIGIERLKRKPEKTISSGAIPAERLSESHRCNSVVADFLREWVYKKDQIDFRSNKHQTLPAVITKTAGLGVVLAPENVFTLIVHDDIESFQSNLVEASIIRTLVESIPSADIGIITPHNAQKGLLKNLLPEGCKDTRVDTVERYQGGEADFIIISSCVSDPDYVRTESEFLLNLNRINVAISRMKKKLVIVASRSIFEFMPQDARDYDKALLWRGISETVGFTADSTPDWAGSLAEFIGGEASMVKVEVYVKSTK
jgi:DEAD/DEAH box helicase.